MDPFRPSFDFFAGTVFFPASLTLVAVDLATVFAFEAAFFVTEAAFLAVDFVVFEAFAAVFFLSLIHI